MGLFDFIFGNDDEKSNPADAAMPYLNQIPGMEKQYYEPYIARGNDAYGRYSNVVNPMTSDPVSFLENILKAYEPSRAFNLRKDQALKSAGNTAAAGGMRGSLQDIDNEARLTDMLMGEDMQQWLQNVLGIQGRGLHGQEHLYDTGYNASQNLAGDLSNVLGTQGQLAFQGQRENNQARSDEFSGLGKLAGAGLGAFFGSKWGGNNNENNQYPGWLRGAADGARIGDSFF